MSGHYSRDQCVVALEYCQRRKEQGVLRRPYEYAVQLLSDWRKRGLHTREQLDDNRLSYELDAA
jgi:DNA replication protein DnaD